MNKLTASSLALSLVALTQAPLLFADTDNKTTPQSLTPSAQQQMSWLGVTLDQVPAVLSAQLSSLIPNGQGVLIRSVSKDSPAEVAGIQNNDVLLSMGDQKLYSAGQLSGLIRTAKPNSKVSFKVVQQGQLKDIEVTLGQRAYNPWQQQPFQGNAFSNMPSWVAPQLAPTPNGNSTNPAPQAKIFGSFESVQVRTLADGRYHAEVSYKDKADESKQFTFEGKKEEIIEQINKHKELPDDKKKALLNALEMNLGSMSNGTIGNFQGFNSPLFNHPFFNQPFGRDPFGGSGNNPFNDPFFQRNPFSDPFFQNAFPNGSLFQGLPPLRMQPSPQIYQQIPQGRRVPAPALKSESQAGSLI